MRRWMRRMRWRVRAWIACNSHGGHGSISVPAELRRVVSDPSESEGSRSDANDVLTDYGWAGSTRCWCPGCHLNLCATTGTTCSDTDLVRFACGVCGHRSTWLFDAPCPILIDSAQAGPYR